MKNSDLCLLMGTVYGSEIFGSDMNAIMGIVAMVAFAVFTYLESRK